MSSTASSTQEGIIFDECVAKRNVNTANPANGFGVLFGVEGFTKRLSILRYLTAPQNVTILALELQAQLLQVILFKEIRLLTIACLASWIPVVIAIAILITVHVILRQREYAVH